MVFLLAIAEAPEPEYDHRTLYDRLQEQKDKKQEEWEESRKFSKSTLDVPLFWLTTCFECS